MSDQCDGMQFALAAFYSQTMTSCVQGVSAVIADQLAQPLHQLEDSTG